MYKIEASCSLCRHSTVHIDLVANGWFEDADAAQGVDRVFHTGEIFSTVGVQNVADYVHKKTPDFVEALNKVRAYVLGFRELCYKDQVGWS